MEVCDNITNYLEVEETRSGQSSSTNRERKVFSAYKSSYPPNRYYSNLSPAESKVGELQNIKEWLAADFTSVNQARVVDSSFPGSAEALAKFEDWRTDPKSKSVLLFTGGGKDPQQCKLI
jgi:hypothetical protein